jgi:hypothetical protein
LSRRYRIVLALLAVFATSLILTAAALGNAFSQVYNSYRKTGHVAPCTFSEAVLNQAKAQVPPDIDQYAPDFPAALDAALQARAQGACAKSAGRAATAAPVAPTTATPPPAAGASAAPAAAGAATAAAATTPVPTTAATAASAPSALAVAGHARGGGGGAPAAIIALAVLAGLLAVAAGIWGLARWRGWDPPWVQYVSHAVSEAGVQAEATWAEFSDWVRLGR